MKVENLMTPAIHTCFAEDSLNRATQIMWETDCGFLPIVDGQHHVIGVVTDRDLLMGAYTQGKCLADASVGSVMSRNVWTCKTDDDVTSVERLMQNHQIRRVPVVNSSSEVVGIVTLGDFARGSQTSTLQKALGGLVISKTLAAITQPRASSAVSAAE